MTQPTQKLAGKVAVVTGAASGMGRATVLTFVEQGAKVYALDISEETLAREYDGNDRVVARACDISDSAAVNAIFEEITEQEGKLDSLVNAAGISTPGRRATEWMDGINHRMIDAMKAGKPFNPEFMTEIPDEDFDRVMKINLYGSFYTIRAAVPLLKAAGGGSITNFASIAGLVALPMPAYYPASKAAVIGMTKSAAGELAPFDIRVNALAPAGINTAMLNQSGDDHVQALLSMQPLKRLAEPEEVAQTLLFLASDDSRHYTGQVFSPSGGAYLAS